MKAKEIQELIDFIAQSGLDEVNIETESFKIAIKRDSVASRQEMPAMPAFMPPVALPAAPAQAPVAAAPAASPAAAPKSDSNYITVKSPMIGTFYKSSNPEAAPFVSVGDTVSKGQPLCIIEAMKLFNEIESEFSGKIVKILVENASPVEYDQPLFVIDPS